MKKAMVLAALAASCMLSFGASGLPKIPDGDAKANPHGVAIKFHVEQSDDPMIDIRNAAYPISFSRRNQ